MAVVAAAAEIAYRTAVIPADVVMAYNLKSTEERVLPELILGGQTLPLVAPSETRSGSATERDHPRTMEAAVGATAEIEATATVRETETAIGSVIDQGMAIETARGNANKIATVIEE